MGLLKEKDIEITLCVKIYMEKHFKDAPEIEYSPDPNPSTISRNTAPLLRWYDEYFTHSQRCANRKLHPKRKYH